MIRVTCQENRFGKYVIVPNMVFFLPKIDFSIISEKCPFFFRKSRGPL